MTAVEISGAGRTEQFVRRRVQRRGVRQDAVSLVLRSERKRLGFARTPDIMMATATMVGRVIMGRSLLVIRRRGCFALVICQANFSCLSSMGRLRQRRRDEGHRKERSQHEAQRGKDRFEAHTGFLTDNDCQNMRQIRILGRI